MSIPNTAPMKLLIISSISNEPHFVISCIVSINTVSSRESAIVIRYLCFALMTTGNRKPTGISITKLIRSCRSTCSPLYWKNHLYEVKKLILYSYSSCEYLPVTVKYNSTTIYSDNKIAALHCSLLNLCFLYRKIETAQNTAKAITEMIILFRFY